MIEPDEDDIVEEQVRNGFGPVLKIGALIAVMAALVGFAPALSGADPEGERVGGGYQAIVDRVMVGGADGSWLTAENATGEGIPAVRLRRDIGERLAPFVRASYLAADLQSEDIGLWRIDRDQVQGINSAAHREPGPYDRTGGWKGAISFRDSPELRVSLRSDTPGSSRRIDFLEQGPEISLALGAVATAAADEATTRAGSVLLTLGDEPVAALRRIENALVIVRRQQNVGTLTVGGSRMPAANAMRVVRPNETVTISLGDKRVETFRLEVENQQVSVPAGLGRRIRNPSTEVFARMAEAMADRIVADRPDIADAPMQLALSEPLQVDVQERLTSIADRLYGELRDAPERAGRPLAPFRATAVVMDAVTGEVIGMATYPSHAPYPGAEGLRDSRSAQLYERHHALDALPIGSVAKAPFAAAILDTPRYSILANLRISDTDDKFDTLLGMPLGGTIQDPATCGTPADFTCFIQRSSNKYASALMLLASSESPAVPDSGPNGVQTGADWYDLGQGRQARLPTMPWDWRRLRADGDPRLRQSSLVFDPPWIDTMKRRLRMPEIGGGAASDEEAEVWDAADRHDLRLWREWFSPHAEGGRRAQMQRRALAQASPELENFGLAGVYSLTPDYLQLILGGARSRWTAVKVAEAFSRIVTGCPTEASFIQLSRWQACPAAPWSSKVLRDALSGVVLIEGGTAASLGPAVRALYEPNASVEVFAKTGTPTLEERWDSPANRALNALIGQGVVVRTNGLLTLRGGEAVTAAALDRMAERGLFRRYGATASQVAERIRVLQDRPGDLRPQVGRLAYVVEDQFSSDGRGGVLALTLVRTPTAAPADRRALTVVINFQSRGQFPDGRNPAVEMMAGLLRHDGPLAQELRSRRHDRG